MDQAVLDDLDLVVHNWSDYNRIYYHPRSVNPIVTHQMDNDITPFDNYTIGRQAYVENEKEVDIFEDNFRFFVEECDRLQGFHLLTDVDDAFGGFTEGLLHHIRDEFAKTPIITFGMSDSFAPYRTQRHQQKIMLNRSLGLTRLAELSSIYQCGLSPYVQFNEMSRYHTSAMIAAALETHSLPYRLKQNSITMADTVSQLNWVRNTRLAALSVCLPLPILKTGYTDTLNMLKPNEMKPMLSLLDKVSKEMKKDVYGEVTVARGLLDNPQDQERYLESLYADFKDTNDPLQSRFSLDCPLPLPDSYPRLFTSRVNLDGFIDPRLSTERPQQASVLTHLASGSELKASIDQHVFNMNSIHINDFWEYTQGEYGLSREDFLETKEKLMTLSDVYNTEDDDMML
ncbi:tubulin domain-containing protein [Gilbertella persicaria]|uniref:tubulin domain-containing protein n=1 Tax=Gilbertella persicaria TaxID=101096 RepID=UPI00221FE639|nr:tubulin domain-containing protein [Gilbertella persicaria]KAI8094975.1 tubulin domain-containing protein [Gilbertella persicaria]